MWRNYLAAALRNLIRSRAYAAINILGLAIGFTAVILIALYVRDELSYDRAYPESGRIYRLLTEFKGEPRTSLAVSDSKLARALELDFPEVEFATRARNGGGILRRKDVEVVAPHLRAEPNFFNMFPPRVVAGDPVAAMTRPDRIVITRRFASRLFGREDVMGESVELNRQQSLQVGAVIENLPSNSHFEFDMVKPASDEEFARDGNAYTYVRLRRGADVRKLNAHMPEFARKHFTAVIGGEPEWKRVELRLVALPDIHFLPPSVADMKAPTDRRTVDSLVVIGVLILLVAAGNFVSMMTARSARRAIEVGVRKVVGATRRQIVIQFLGESLFYAGLALVVAIIAVQVLLPGFNSFLHKEMAFDFMRDPMLGATVAAVWLAVSLAAGAYPALVLSHFRPVGVLKGVLSLSGGPGRLRQLMVVLQFATLMGLIVATLTVQRQARFAIDDQLRIPGEQLYVMRSPCIYNFRTNALKIPGVLEASCSSYSGLGMDRGGSQFILQAGGAININPGHVDAALFGLFGIKPLAGRLFDDQHGEDNLLVGDRSAAGNPSIILNEAAARALGYANPSQAVGSTRHWRRVTLREGTYTLLDAQPSQIVGVVPDFTVGSIRNAIQPTAYFIDPGMSSALVLRLDGKAIPEAMRALEAEWKRVSRGEPFVEQGRFMSQVMNDLYSDILRQAKLFAVFAAVAIIVAALGLLGLAIFTAERRTREIGVRKCMGASRMDILRFISWQFARPVLIANLVAWPVAWYFMQRWLQGFAYHVDLGPMAFVLASALALSIAFLTVTGHALMVARARPVDALRNE